ncbi:MAG: DUF3667 domain-containing protein [Flavobacteriaceae bacterium]|nr:DUF3667 domain-containing protein [Flavobacteriaceae bacterium]
MNCRVCNKTYGLADNFCPSCGEKINPKRLSVKSFFSAFLSEFLDYDNRLFKTFRHMFSHPEWVINSYVQGNRKLYVNVLGYLSISLTLIAIQTFVLKRFFPELLINEQAQGIEGLDLKPIFDAIFDYQGILTIALTPLAAMMSRLVFLGNKKYNLAEHMVINVYPTAQFYIFWFFFTAVIVSFGIPYQNVSFIVIPLLALYMCFIFKRLYDLSIGIAALKTILYFFLYMIAFLIFYFVVIVIYVAYLTASGQFDPSSI